MAVKEWKELIFDCDCVSYIYLPSYVYIKDVFTEWWNKHFRGSGKQIFLCCPAIVGGPLQKSLKSGS